MMPLPQSPQHAAKSTLKSQTRQQTGKHKRLLIVLEYNNGLKNACQDIISIWAYMVRGYKAECFYWELLVMARSTRKRHEHHGTKWILLAGRHSFSPRSFMHQDLRIAWVCLEACIASGNSKCCMQVSRRCCSVSYLRQFVPTASIALIRNASSTKT